ncbi:MAG: autotransporter-associated beta strand repeat-containing protein, partial [Verrucomicrobiota bacterium]
LHFGHRDNDTFTLAQFGNDINYTDAGNEFDGTNQEFNLWTAGLQSVADGSNDGMTIALDGVQVTQDANRTTQFLNANNGRVGRGFGGANQSYDGDLGEIIIYDRSLTPEERVLVEAYLRDKWFGTSGSVTASNILPTDTDVNITNSGATLDLNGVNQQIASLEGVSGSAVTMGSGDLIIDGSANADFAGVISGTGNLTKAGTGTQILSGDNTYTGTTSVTGGILFVDGNQSSATGSVTVASGATLGGTGTLGGNTLIEGGGTVTAGTVGNTTFADPDLDFGGDLTVGGGSAASWLVDLVGGTGNDVVDVAGSLTLANANLAITAGGTINVGDQFIIANYGTLTGTFSNASAASQFTLGGQNWNIDYGSGTGDAITLTAVPEPATVIPLILILVSVFWFIRRKKSSEPTATL